MRGIAARTTILITIKIKSQPPTLGYLWLSSANVDDIRFGSPSSSADIKDNNPAERILSVATSSPCTALHRRALRLTRPNGEQNEIKTEAIEHVRCIAFSTKNTKTTNSTRVTCSSRSDQRFLYGE